MYVLTDRQTVHIFTRPLGLDQLRHFLIVLGLQRLDMLNLMGGNSKRSGKDKKAELDEEFDFVTAEEVEDGYEGPKPKTTEQGNRKARTRT